MNVGYFRFSVPQGDVFVHRCSEPNVNLTNRSDAAAISLLLRSDEDVLHKLWRKLGEGGNVSVSSRQFNRRRQIEELLRHQRLHCFLVPKPDLWINRNGDVTVESAIAGYPSYELEKRIGYQAGRLSRGYCVYALHTHVAAGEFTWSGDTSTSQGLNPSRRLQELANPKLQKGQTEFTADQKKDIDFFKDVALRSHRSDDLRFALYKKNSFNQKLADEEFDLFLEKQRLLLNIREGHNRIVKIIPTIRHDNDLLWYKQYPDSKIRGTLQWTLHRGTGKNPEGPKSAKSFEFKLLAFVPPGFAF